MIINFISMIHFLFHSRDRILKVKISVFLLGGGTRSKSLARELRTSSSLPGCLDGVYSGYHHDVAKNGRYQHRIRDSLARVDTVIALIFNCKAKSSYEVKDFKYFRKKKKSTVSSNPSISLNEISFASIGCYRKLPPGWPRGVERTRRRRLFCGCEGPD